LLPTKFIKPNSFKKRQTKHFATTNYVDLLDVEQKLGITIHPRRFRKATKQLATLGPASNNIEMIEKLFLSGADSFRLNFSHGEHAEKARLVGLIRAIEKKYDHPIAILADLQVYTIQSK
jgi:hypothetical protein